MVRDPASRSAGVDTYDRVQGNNARFPSLASFYAGDEQAQAELLNDALASGHPGYIASALGVIARARGMSELAAETGFKRQQLYRALSEDGNPTLETLTRVIKALGFRLTVERDAA